MEKLAGVVEIEQLQPVEPGTMEVVLEDCLELCRADDRGLLEKKYFEQWSYNEIAAELQTTPKAIESRLARLRERLRRCILERLRHV